MKITCTRYMNKFDIIEVVENNECPRRMEDIISLWENLLKSNQTIFLQNNQKKLMEILRYTKVLYVLMQMFRTNFKSTPCWSN